MPGALGGNASEERIDGQRRGRRRRQGGKRDRAREPWQVRQQPGAKRRRINAGDPAQPQPAVGKELQVHIALTGFEYR